jgi:hypothetical protein
VRARLNAVAALVLAIGLGAGGAIYVSAEEDPGMSVQELLWSRSYNRELQRFGGKAAVAFDDFQRWFASLWRGKSLGVTIIWLSVCVSGGLYWVARRYKD